MDLAPGTVVASRYVVDQLLGRGGMAAVYRVHHQQLGTSHALKVLLVHGAGVRERLLREGRLQGQVHHPNVVAVTDQVDVNGAPGLVLEMVEGPSLAAVLGGPPLSVDQIDVLGAGVLAGVAAAHRHRLVHRDLKPANVLVAVREGRPVPKVADFGLALALDDGDARKTRTGAHLGTPQYMAPEQVRDAKDVDERADVWALGALLYELAAGVPPFAQTDRLELYSAIAAGRFVPLGELRPDLPPRMVQTVERALQVDRDARPADAVALASLWGDAAAIVPDPLVDRVLALAPPPSSRTATPPPASSAPLTWAPEPRAPTPFATPPSTPLEPSLDLPPPKPVPASTTAPSAWASCLVPLMAAVSMLVVGGVGAVSVIVVAALVWTRPEPAAPIVVQVPAPVRTPVAPGEVERVVHPSKAIDALLDGRFADAEVQASYFLAGGGTEAAVVQATARAVRGDWYGPREVLQVASTADTDGRVAAMIESFSDPAHASDWLRDHPDDAEVRVFVVALACPGPTCAAVEPLVADLERRYPGRAVGAWARQRWAWSVGQPASAGPALEDWASRSREEPQVAVERGWWLLVSGRAEEAAQVVDAAIGGDDRPYAPLVVLRGRLDRELGSEGRRIDSDRLAANLIWYQQVAWAREVAAFEVARGRPREALDGLGRVRTSYQHFNDGLVDLLDAEVCLELMALAVEVEDLAVMDRAVGGLRDLVARTDLPPFARETAERARLQADAMRLVSRGRDADARRVLEDLRAGGATDHELRHLLATLER